MSHDYVSTACLHGLHGSCRKTCKFCDAPCQCPGHILGEAKPADSNVDKARNIARELLRDALHGPISPALLRRIEAEPSLFWLRGEEVPPGEWRKPGEEIPDAP